MHPYQPSTDPYKPVKDLEISSDSLLLTYFRQQMNEVSFLRSETRNALDLLRDIDLHLQTDALVDIWKKLIEDAIVFLKLKDDREIYHDTMTLGTERLHGFLTEFQKFENILYGAIVHYRDHIAHVFRVFLLGHYIVKTSIGFENLSPDVKTLNLSEADKQAFFISPEEKEAMWCILALTHDLGYPLEVIYQINQRVRDMLQQFGNIPVQELGHSYFTQFKEFSDYTIRFLSSDLLPLGNGKYGTHLQAKYYMKFLSALSIFDHGIISTTILTKNLVFFKESDFMLDSLKPLGHEDARQFLIRKEILRSIACHNLDEIYYLAIRNFPFVLTICDEMQEWGRPRLIDITKRGASESKLTINKFSKNVVDYTITFAFPTERYTPSQREIELASAEVKNYFLRKKEKWQNVLRSAVGGELRDLTLIFRVIDLTTSPGKEYVLKHPNPEQVVVEEFVRKK